ncbi:MAG: hypothetical protein MZV64_12785 [Ignavibacteriales bacterium]|nr:hypothetical protein [Ignavibacteriales bacterium]
MAMIEGQAAGARAAEAALRHDRRRTRARSSATSTARPIALDGRAELACGVLLPELPTTPWPRATRWASRASGSTAPSTR